MAAVTVDASLIVVVLSLLSSIRIILDGARERFGLRRSLPLLLDLTILHHNRWGRTRRQRIIRRWRWLIRGPDHTGHPPTARRSRGISRRCRRCCCCRRRCNGDRTPGIGLNASRRSWGRRCNCAIFHYAVIVRTGYRKEEQRKKSR